MSIKMRRLSSIVAVLAGGALSFSVAPATAAPQATAPAEGEEVAEKSEVNTLTADEETELREFFDAYGVEDAIQASLVESLQNGEPWDSLSGEEPVDVARTIENGVTTEVETYADGSIVVSQTDTPDEPDDVEPGLAPKSVSGCQIVSSSNYHADYENCLAHVNVGVMSMGFYFDRETVRGTVGTISRGYGHHHHVVGGALSNHRVESMSSSQMRYSADVSLAFEGFPVGWTAWMQANQGTGTQVWTTNN